MMFNTEMIAEDLKGGKEDMTENKRFIYNECEDCIEDNIGEEVYWGLDDVLCNLLNELNDENNRIKQTIQTAINNERTDLGKNALKQVWEQIQ